MFDSWIDRCDAIRCGTPPHGGNCTGWSSGGVHRPHREGLPLRAWRQPQRQGGADTHGATLADLRRGVHDLLGCPAAQFLQDIFVSDAHFSAFTECRVFVSNAVFVFQVQRGGSEVPIYQLSLSLPDTFGLIFFYFGFDLVVFAL